MVFNAVNRTFSALIVYIVFLSFFSFEANALNRIPVFVSILPQKYFVEKVGGDLVDVSVMVKPGADAHTFEPRPQQMIALSLAKIYFTIGIEFEKVWLERFNVTNPNMVIVRTDSGIKKIPMKAYHNRLHEGKHHHSSEDPHIWLSPPLVMNQVQNIRDGLISADPDNEPVYTANCERFIAELKALDAELKRIFAGRKGLQFMVFHSSWGYFANTYRLRQIPVEIEGKTPKPAELQHLIQHAREHEIKMIFVQPQFSASSAEVIAKAIGGQVAFVDPLAENWAENLREVARTFRAALR